MYIAVIQNNPYVGALKGNMCKALESIDALAASAYPPDLVVFGAYALTGCPLAGLQFSDSFAFESLEVARMFMEKASLPTLVGTILPRPIPQEMTFICEAEVLFCKGEESNVLGFVDYSDNWEDDRYASSITTMIDGHVVSVLLDDYPDAQDDFSDSEIVVMMLAKEYRGTNTMFTASERLGYLRGFAQKNDVWVVVANMVGAQDTSVFDGASLVLRPDGSVVDAVEPFVEGVITCNLDLSKPKGDPAAQKGAIAGAGEHIIKPLLPYEADWKAMELFIRDYVHKNGFEDVVLGLSGGLDCAVVAALACDALGPGHVHGVMMPGPFSSKGSVDDSLALAANLGIETLRMPIDEPFKVFRDALMEVRGTEGSQLALQNIQPRIRMAYLMQLCNTYGWLLLNTSNKSEAAMGYSTLYGDAAGAISPLGNIYKTDVYGLARWRNQRRRIIPQAILDKAPSAELYEGQTDEDSLPAYAVLDRVLKLHIEEGLGVDQILAYTAQDPDEEGLDSQTVEGILAAVRAAEHKRRQAPPAPTLGYIDMNMDRDWPMTNGFVDTHRHSGILLSAQLSASMDLLDNWGKPQGWDFLAN